MDIDIFDETLFDGTDDEIKALVGFPDVRSSYEYVEELESFTVRYGPDIVKHYGPVHKPNCVDVLGSSFVFK